jgi:hypothetical protein
MPLRSSCGHQGRNTAHTGRPYLSLSERPSGYLAGCRICHTCFPGWEQQSVVPEGYPGSNWLTGSQHQVNSTLVLGRSAARVPIVARRHSRFHSPVEARRAMWNWLVFCEYVDGSRACPGPPVHNRRTLVWRARFGTPSVQLQCACQTASMPTVPITAQHLTNRSGL